MDKTYFWEYLTSNKIEIPIIQRDYAQGRKGKEYLRKRFLSSLKDALDNMEGRELKLDFVYGSSEDGALQPLDGQQRLTTLWLLHWYVALKAGKLGEAASVLRRFSYETRLSSRQFCENLCNADNFTHYNSGIVSFIEKQTWFYAAWKRDPTIQSMLRMLGGKVVDNDGKSNKDDNGLADGIEKVFGDGCDFNRYWQQLTSTECPIVFYQMSLENFGLTDDLYIKMNARGKQLTPFENLKADLIGYIRKKSEADEMWKPLSDVRNGMPLKFDTTWAELFWQNRSTLYTVDEIYLTFINRFFWNQLFMFKSRDKKYILSVGQGIVDGKAEYTIENRNASYQYLNADDCHRYIGFEPYMFYTEDGKSGQVPLGTFQALMTVLDRYCKAKDIGLKLGARWDDNSFAFIPTYDGHVAEKAEDLGVSPITQIQRIAFFAVCKYLEDGDVDDVSLRRWMRVVWNVISIQDEDGQPQIRDTSAMRRAMELLGQLDSHHVYESLRNETRTSDTLIDVQLNEEVVKAKQILADDGTLRKYEGNCLKDDGSHYGTWEEIIMDAEAYSFFHGSIRFLFLNDNNKTDWSTFDTKWDNVRRFFKKRIGHGQSAMNGHYDNALLLKSLLSKLTLADVNEDTIWFRHRTFNNRPATWLYYLLNDKLRKYVHELLMSPEPELSPQKTVGEGDDIEKANALYLLTQTGLLDYVMKHLPKSWIRPYRNHTAIYPSSEGVFLNASRRDHFLLTTPGIDVDENCKIKDTELLYKWNISFTYKGRNFQWDWKDIIYQMEDNNPENYRVKNAAGQDETERYYCFDTKGKSSDDDIISWLDSRDDNSHSGVETAG